MIWSSSVSKMTGYEPDNQDLLQTRDGIFLIMITFKPALKLTIFLPKLGPYVKQLEHEPIL
jgi:hypothetical protein